MKESALQNKITRYLKSQNRFYTKSQGGVSGTQNGTPDIITIDDNGVLVGLELKRPDKIGSYGVTNEQLYQGRKIKKFNGRWYKIDSWKSFELLDGFSLSFKKEDI